MAQTSSPANRGLAINRLVDRRAILAGGLSLLGLAPTSARLLAAAGSAPVARVAPVIDDYYGAKVIDRYRWMEDPTDPEWLPYLRAQNAHARSFLDAIPGRAALAQRISECSADTTHTLAVRSAGTRLFYEQRPAGADNYMLFQRVEGKAQRIVIDPTTMTVEGAHVSLDWWSPSFDGRFVAYGLSPAGSEASVLHIVEVDTGEVLPERIPMTDSARPAWLPDASGFFYNQLTGERGKPTLYRDSVIRHHRLRTDPGSDALVMRRGLDPNVALEPLQWPHVVTAPMSDHALGIVADIRTESALYLTPLTALAAGRPRWRKVADFDDLVTGHALVEDMLYLLTNKGAVRGRVIRTSVRAPDLGSATSVLPQGKAVIERLSGARDGVFATIMDGGIQRVSRIGHDGRVLPLALPFQGAVSDVFSSADQVGAYLSLVGWLQPGGIWKVGKEGAVADTGLSPAPPIDLSPYEARRAFATARDGVRVPYTVVARKDARAAGAKPTLVEAYGAYQYSETPRFRPTLLPFLDAGGVFVSANVRGGGEYGREWHKAGQKATKSNTWRDLIDVCQKLIRTRITSPARIAIMGTSAGGIAAGRAMTERPELFAAVISDVGWSNPIRYVAEQNVSDIDEWGPITDASSFRIMLAMDSYQAVRDGTRYPAVLCVTGATDPRVAPWHVAKFAARLQAATASGNPVLLRVEFDAGHGMGSTRRQRDALAADVYAFVLWRTGAGAFQATIDPPPRDRARASVDVGQSHQQSASPTSASRTSA
jgi:prolyl oligopeptidase